MHSKKNKRSTISSPQPSVPHHNIADEGMEVELEKPTRMLNACGNIVVMPELSN